jgi:hypothetical protein
LSQNEFHYPKGSEPKQVWTSTKLKQASNWGLKVDSDDDLYQFCTTIQNMVTDYNIYIKPYEQLTKPDDIALITPHNCSNYETSYATMTIGIFLLLDQNKDDISENYQGLKYSIEAF